MKQIISLLLFFNIFSCSFAQSQMPKLPLVNIQYKRGYAMSMYPTFFMRFETHGDSVTILTFNPEIQGNCLYLATQAGVMDTLRQVIEKNEMYKYESSYVNREVRDGWYWNYSATFSDNASPKPNKDYLSSSGTNQSPKNSAGLGVMQKKMQAAFNTAVFLYTCDEEGREIPNVPLEVRRGDRGSVDYLYLIHSNYRLDIRFDDIEESEKFHTLFGDITPKKYFTLKQRAERCYGSKIIDEGKTSPVLYLIVDNGAVEAVDVKDLVLENPQTKRFSITKGLVDVKLVDGVVKGIDNNGKVVNIKWERTAKK